MKDIAGVIEHSLLGPTATAGDIIRLCEEAVRHGFYSVCINPHFVRAAKEALAGSGVRVTTVIGFPLGATLTEAKVHEAMDASLLGADELDMVMNIGEAKAGNWGVVAKDISDVVMATRECVHKVIIEACYLTGEEKKRAAHAALEAGAEYVKTSTGFGPGGAGEEDVRLIKSVVGGSARIKAAGGIKTLSQIRGMLEAGASLIGTSSGVEIIRELSTGRLPGRR
jgi:deoxyribose-phosphate aldolase